jgi:hypothetical protein
LDFRVHPGSPARFQLPHTRLPLQSGLRSTVVSKHHAWNFDIQSEGRLGISSIGARPARPFESLMLSS